MKTPIYDTCAETEEINLGWNAMPAYGEVMPKLTGTSFSPVKSLLSIGKRPAQGLVQTFWSMLANVK